MEWVRRYNFGFGMVGEQGVGRTGCWENRVLGEQGVGRTGCWENRVLGEQGVGRTGCWENRVLGEQGAGRTGCWENRVLGEQGAESIHRRFNALNITHSSIRNKEKRLRCIVKEHLISIAPDSIRAQPPPTNRVKRTPKHVLSSMVDSQTPSIHAAPRRSLYSLVRYCLLL